MLLIVCVDRGVDVAGKNEEHFWGYTSAAHQIVAGSAGQKRADGPFRGSIPFKQAQSVSV